MTLYAHERTTVLVPVPTPYRRELAAEVRARHPVDWTSAGREPHQRRDARGPRS